MDLFKCSEQNVNNQSLTEVSQLYVHISFCLKVIGSCLNLPTGGHGHVICMGDGGHVICMGHDNPCCNGSPCFFHC